MRTAIRVLLAVIALAAIGQQLRLHLAASYDVVNFFSYFTNLSNLFACAVLLLCALTSPSKPNGAHDIARFISTTNMAVVGVVFAALLRNVDLGDLLPWVNIMLHYVMPVAVVIDWLWQPPAVRLSARHLLLASLFPLLYLAYVLLRGASIGWYPYPFLNPANVGGYGGVAAYSVAITTTFVAAGSALLWIGNRRRAAAAA